MQAASDPEQKILYRGALLLKPCARVPPVSHFPEALSYRAASDLAEKFECPLNAVAMYFLRRKRRKSSGIFQATGFRYKVKQHSSVK